MPNKRRQKKYSLQVEFVPTSESSDPKFLKDFPNYVLGTIRSEPGDYVTSPSYAKAAESIYNLKLRPDDVFVISFPKCGSTWMLDLVWMIVNNCDFEKAKALSIQFRAPLIEVDYLAPKSVYQQIEREGIAKVTKMPWLVKAYDVVNYFKVMDALRPMIKKLGGHFLGEALRNVDDIDGMASPRVLKSHLPFYLLNPNLLDTCKVVYVARNPKDVIVSYFHYHKLFRFQKFEGDLESFANYFISDKVLFSPFFPHLLDAWSKRHHPNLLFIFYEDLKRDLRGEIEKVANFLGKAPSDEQLNQLTNHLRLDTFKTNEAVNHEKYKKMGIMEDKDNFIRKGKTGDWKNHFTPELNERIEQWMATHLAGSDLSFITELEQQD